MLRKVLILILILFLAPVALASDNSVEGIETTAVKVISNSLSAPDIGNMRIQQAKYDPYPAEPGEYVTIWISIQNWGKTDIKTAVFQLEPEYPFSLLPGDDGVKEIGLLPSFRERLLEYKLKVDKGAIEGTNDFKLHLCKDETCDIFVKTSEIEVTVKTGGTPKVRIGLEDSSTFYAGMTGTVTINAINRGTLDTKFLLIDLAESDKYTIISPAEIYIGELESDDFETAEFKIYVHGNVGLTESEELELPIHYEYSDENDKEYIGDSKVLVHIYSQDDLKKIT